MKEGDTTKADEQLPEGILLVSKPRGMSSFDVIRELRKRLGIKKMGHAGTLDPLAEGLMIIGVGKGTKKLSRYSGLDKTYLADIWLGVQTDTGDEEGEVLAEKEVEHLPPEDEVVAVLERLTGDITLEVPRYSAVKQGGVPLYKLARRGEEFKPPRRVMKVEKQELCGTQKDGKYALLSVRMHVGSGVYVRSIAEKVGRELGFPASVSRLVRERVGEYARADAYEISEVTASLLQ